MLAYFWKVAFLGALAFPGAVLAKTVQIFDITTAPKVKDWQFFNKMSEDDREALWTEHFRQGKHLKDWIWGWRLGWVRTCTFSARKYCRDLLEEALFDKALVVRAEAASRIGDRFEGTKNPRIVRLLAEAYGDKRNLRHKKPLYVQQRLLYSIKQVGGPLAQELGAALASKHPQSKLYWDNVNKF